MKLPDYDEKPRRAHNYIDKDEYHSLFEWAASSDDSTEEDTDA